MIYCSIIIKIFNLTYCWLLPLKDWYIVKFLNYEDILPDFIKTITASHYFYDLVQLKYCPLVYYTEAVAWNIQKIIFENNDSA